MGDVPEDILDIIRFESQHYRSPTVASGEIVGDVLRRLAVRTIVSQVSRKAEADTAPFQHELSTKAGCECVAHTLHVDERATIVSIDGIDAYDFISRNAMFQGLFTMEDGDRVLSFVKCFCETRWGSPKTYSKGREGSRVTL